MTAEDPNKGLISPQATGTSLASFGSGAFSIDQLIERWWQDHFPGSAVARDTKAWNTAHAAKEALKGLLRGSI